MSSDLPPLGALFAASRAYGGAPWSMAVRWEAALEVYATPASRARVEARARALMQSSAVQGSPEQWVRAAAEEIAGSVPPASSVQSSHMLRAAVALQQQPKVGRRKVTNADRRRRRRARAARRRNR